jgi:hypothetical protein
LNRKIKKKTNDELPNCKLQMIMENWRFCEA